MGVEIKLFPIPNDWDVMSDAIAGNQPGYLLQHMGFLFSSLLDGESGEEWFEDLTLDNEPECYIKALHSWFDEIKSKPHLLGMYFDGASRGHDHWAYLLELAADNEREKELAHSAIFGSQAVHASAVASQGIPIRWSTAEQVAQISALISNREHGQKTEERFDGFPDERVFYKRRSDDQFQGCMYELDKIREFYHRASNANFAVASILD